MIRTRQYEEINSFLKENGYSYTVSMVLVEYKERYGRWYVSSTMKHTIMNCIKPIKELVEMGY